MSVDENTLRRRSSSLFGIERFAEIVLAFDAEGPGVVPLKDLVERSGSGRNYVNPVLSKLLDLAAIRQHPRLGGSRGPVHYEVAEPELWTDLVALCRRISVEAVNRSAYQQ